MRIAQPLWNLSYPRKISGGVLNGKLQSRSHQALEAEQPELSPGSCTPEKNPLTACVGFSLVNIETEDRLPFLSVLLSIS